MVSFNQICGVVLSENEAKHYLVLTRSLYNTAHFALRSNRRHNFASQTQSTGAINAAVNSSFNDEDICTAKRDISSRHIAFYENWKDIKYRGYTYDWPQPEHRSTLWKTFALALDENRPLYKMRNWFAYSFGGYTTSLATEQENFNILLQEYEDILPGVEELMTKLAEGLDDKLASVDYHRARVYEPWYGKEKPSYVQDCETVLL